MILGEDLTGILNAQIFAQLPIVTADTPVSPQGYVPWVLSSEKKYLISNLHPNSYVIYYFDELVVTS